MAVEDRLASLGCLHVLCRPGCRRHLHPSPAAGVNTCDIITLYISAIKALRVLDPSMVILEVACEPVRRYLR